MRWIPVIRSKLPLCSVWIANSNSMPVFGNPLEATAGVNNPVGRNGGNADDKAVLRTCHVLDDVISHEVNSGEWVKRI